MTDKAAKKTKAAGSVTAKSAKSAESVKGTAEDKSTKNAEIIKRLHTLYPDAGPELCYSNEFELLIAAILSAQCTDKRVNLVTEELFAKYGTPQEFAALETEELEPLIKTCGLYKAKAKSIIGACRIITEEFNGEVPRTHEELMRLPGVGRKVANVVLSNAFGIPAIAVDTHVFRVTNRIGVARAATPEKTELQLMEAIPKDEWSIAHHLFIFHGRRVCFARNPNCEGCRLNDLCEYSMDENTHKTSN